MIGWLGWMFLFMYRICWNLICCWLVIMLCMRWDLLLLWCGLVCLCLCFIILMLFVLISFVCVF